MNKLRSRFLPNLSGMGKFSMKLVCDFFFENGDFVYRVTFFGLLYSKTFLLFGVSYRCFLEELMIF